MAAAGAPGHADRVYSSQTAAGSGPPRVVLADFHPGVLFAVGEVLTENGFDVVATAADGIGALEAVERHRPDVALVDPRLPRVAGVELVRRLRAVSPGTRVALYTADADAGLARDVLRAGAVALVLKEAPLGDLVRALRSALAGRPYVDSGLARAGLPGGAPGLTEREAEVLALLADGLSHDEIGRRLRISGETVRTHLQKARRRLGAENRTHAVALALRLRLIA
jgi:DNA-binding NarL/FixJ family response regulator